MQENPFFQDFGTRLNSFPFDRFKLEHFEPAVLRAIELAREQVNKIKKNPEKATFENTIVAMEFASEKLDEVSSVFFNLLSAEAEEPMHDLAQKLSPVLSEFENDVALDADLFLRVKSVYDQRGLLKLDVEENRLLEKSYKSFARNGALLNPEQKQSLRNIDEELSKLWPKFSQNVLKATNAYSLHVTDAKRLEGIPASALGSAREKAQSLNKEGWVFGLDAPSYLAVVTYCEDEDLRKQLWLAFATRAYKDDFDNREILKKIVEFRQKRARLLGYEHHANYVLAERMAETPDRVWKFLRELVQVAKPAALKEVNQVKSLKKELTGKNDFYPWDFSFYSEKLKKKLLDFDDQELRPYFQLERVTQGVFEHARRLFGLAFTKVKDIPVYHKDVQVFEVHDEDSGKFMGLFYADFFPRSTKKSGAWMTNFRGQYQKDGVDYRPHVSITCNFSKPTQDEPALLTHDEVLTFFHEFGHALHSLLSECKFNSLSGTSVYWDFVELPSQIMENWVYERESLDLFATHYKTGESMPAALIDKVKHSLKFMAGYSSCRQLQFGLLDMSWYTHPDPLSLDVTEFEKISRQEANVFSFEEDVNMSCSFSHIFSGGYAAGYYSYKWAEVLDADAFELFKERGLFNREAAESFRKNILSRGGSDHPMELYKRFRGREPDPKALLRREGLA